MALKGNKLFPQLNDKQRSRFHVKDPGVFCNFFQKNIKKCLRDPSTPLSECVKPRHAASEFQSGSRCDHSPCAMRGDAKSKWNVNVTSAPMTGSVRSRARAVARVPAGRGWRLALAGGIAGMLSNTALHPLDTVKTIRQTDPAHFAGMLPTIRKLLRSRGVTALYAGLGPALIGSALSSALYFGAYELAKRRLLRHAPLSIPLAPLHATAAVCGNVASSVLFVPKEVVKTRMQAGVDSGRFMGAALRILQTSGPSGLYRGYKATLLRNIPSTVLRFALYEELRARVLSARNRSGTGARLLAAGAVAGATASAFTTPMDVVKTRLGTGRIQAGTGVLEALKIIVRQHGIQGLYFGVRPRALWAALGTGIGFGSYELCKMLLVGEDAFRPVERSNIGKDRAVTEAALSKRGVKR